MAWTRWLGTLLVVLGSAGAPSAWDGGRELWPVEVVAAQEALVEGLDELATWCSGRKLFASRDRAFEDILLFQPDHYRAHKGLKHTQDRDGRWSPPEKPVVSKDYKPRDVPKAEAQRQELVDEYRTVCLRVLAERGLEPLEPSGGDLLETVLWLMPDDPEVRALLLEEQDGEEWVLRETVAAKGRREELRELQRQALAQAGPAVRSSQPTEDEVVLGVRWTHTFASDAVRALGTGDQTEVLKVAQASHAVGDFFRGVFGTDTEHWEATRIFVLARDGERDIFLQNHPAVPPDAVASYAGLVGTGFPESADVVMWNAEMLHRLDSSTRMTMGSFLRQAYGITPDHGWVWEGFGMYLTWRLIGTRLTWYSPGTGDPPDLRLRLADPKAQWMNEAYQLLKDQPPALETFLSKGLAEMDARDMLLSFVLASYLLEGRSEEVPQVLERIGAGGEPSAHVLSDVSGLSLDVFEKRFRRWLTERR